MEIPHLDLFILYISLAITMFWIYLWIHDEIEALTKTLIEVLSEIKDNCEDLWRERFYEQHKD